MNSQLVIAVFGTFVDLFVLVFNGLLLVRVVLSWIMPDLQSNSWSRIVYDLTEPILGPIRRVLPQSQGIDWAPLIAFFLLRIIQAGLYYLISRLI